MQVDFMGDVAVSSSDGSSGSAAHDLLVAAALGPAHRLQTAIAAYLSRFGATKPFTRQSCSELLSALSVACTADEPECVSLLLRTTATVTRMYDCALHSLVAAAAAGSARALAAILDSPELREFFNWRGPKAASLLAQALSDAFRAALSAPTPAATGACFAALLAALGRPHTALGTAARAALGGQMRGVFCAAAAAGARGALQALLVGLPEHCEMLDAGALAAAQRAGQDEIADEIRMLLAMRGPDATTTAAEQPAPSISDLRVLMEQQASGASSCGGSAVSGSAVATSWGSAASACMFPTTMQMFAKICEGSDAAAAVTTPAQLPVAVCGRGAAAHTGKRAGGSVSSFASSDGGSSDWGSSRETSSPGCSDDGGFVGEFDLGGASRGIARQPQQPHACVHPYMQHHAAAPHAVPHAASGHPGKEGSGAFGSGLRGALLRAIQADDVATAAQLLTRLVEAYERSGASAAPAPSDHAARCDNDTQQHPAAQPELEALILELLSASGAAVRPRAHRGVGGALHAGRAAAARDDRGPAVHL